MTAYPCASALKALTVAAQPCTPKDKRVLLTARRPSVNAALKNLWRVNEP
jgi:hypothetical protein